MSFNRRMKCKNCAFGKKNCVEKIKMQKIFPLSSKYIQSVKKTDRCNCSLIVNCVQNCKKLPSKFLSREKFL